MRRLLPVAAIAAAVCFSQAPATAYVPAGDAAPLGQSVGQAAVPSAAQARAARKVRTKFALAGSAYGSRVDGGEVPANSRDTAFERIGCTNVAGNEVRNFEADLTIPGLGRAEGVLTRVFTKKVGETVSVVSQHSIAKVVIGSSPLGAIELIGLRSTSEAFNKNGRFGTTVDNEIARIVLRPAVGPAQQLAIPAPGRTLTIPGLASISLGKAVRSVSGAGARISANVVDVRVIPLGTRVRVAQTNASIAGGIRQGVFKGYAAGVEARGLDDNLKVGRTPLTLLPCQGTKGVKRKDIAGVDLGALGQLGTVVSAANATNQTRVADGTVVGAVADVSLFDGRVQIKGIVAAANVKRVRGVLSRSSAGTTVLEVVVDGQRFEFPAVGAIEIPGLLKLEDRIVTRTKNGMRVVGLRITVLDGTGAVVDLGVVEIGIRPGVPARR